MANIKTTIENDRQRYVDEPVYVEVSKAKPLALAINHALKSRRGASRGPTIAPVITDLSHYDRVHLRWLAPDGKGGLAPKYARDGGALK